MKTQSKLKSVISRKYNAFSLTELLVVLIIIGILVLIALPNFLPKITEAKAQEAKLQLKHVYTLQKSHFYMNSKYSSSLDEIGFEQVELVDQDGNANYKIEITSADNSGFTSTATSITDFDGDGIFNQWQIDEKQTLTETIKD